MISNRLLPCLLLAAPALLSMSADAAGDDAANTSSQFRKETFVSSEGRELKYRIHVPGSADDDTNFPLVLFLHGAGERGNDNEAQLKHGVTEFLTKGRAEAVPGDYHCAAVPARHEVGRRRMVASRWNGHIHVLAVADYEDGLRVTGPNRGWRQRRSFAIVRNRFIHGRLRKLVCGG